MNLVNTYILSNGEARTIKNQNNMERRISSDKPGVPKSVV